MAFSDAMQWWEEWQLRILVLCSLFLQYFLFIAASLRKRCVPAWFKFLTWLAYLASDAVAIYALATLFNRHKRQEWLSTHRSSASLEVLWAPILLLHLGGQDGITAYNIEDNELWGRHVVTAVSQITVAIYVFRKSWPGEKKIIAGHNLDLCSRYSQMLEKPYALKSASIHSIGDTSNKKTWVERMFEEESKDNDDIKSLDDYVKAASKYVQGDHAGETPETGVNEKPYNLFVDLAFPYSDRLKNLKYMMQEKNKAHRRLRSRLSNTFDRLYTKHQMSSGLNICDLTCKSFWGNELRSVVVYLTFAAIALFHKSHRENYDDTDVKITYTLLCCTAALEYIISGIKPCVDFIERINRRLRSLDPTWPDLVAQYNLLWYLARSRKHRRLRRLLLICRDSIDEIWCMKPCQSSSDDITELVFDHVVNHGWKNRIKDAATFHEFNNNRGQQTLQREGCNAGMPLESLQRPFDESVILWHLATDFCFFHHGMDAAGKSASGGHGDGDARRRRSREISNYMAYLLFTNPEMLMPGSRRSLFKNAYEKLKKMAGDEETKKPPLLDEQQMIASQIMQKLQSDKEGSEGLVLDAWVLAQKLMDITGKEGEAKMWSVIQGVWVEMLCFSAGRCRGFLHAKSLGKGGEYLSYVWMLMSFLGMETLAERLQRTELHVQGDMGATRPMTPAASEMPTPTGSDNV
ncbi:unnamed protein product [Miscanthus lutarioriparius]|uniref:DUF4220 domain-containing protein n=1 Tax=Miscanthus lutarioriparius TaxID=422564 RepID=A0A811QC35_9POAL|nr:unnamed protein product [Miscanthus lutarioriparius]